MLMKKFAFSNIRSQLSFQSSSTTMPSIKSKREDRMEISVPRNILSKNSKSYKGSLTITLIFTNITGAIILSLTRSFLYGGSTI